MYGAESHDQVNCQRTEGILDILLSGKRLATCHEDLTTQDLVDILQNSHAGKRCRMSGISVK